MATAISIGVILLLAMIYWLSNISQRTIESEQWLKLVFRHIGPIRQPLLPSTWTARGIVAAMERRVDESVFYLLVVVGNAFFLSWLTINVIARSWAEAFSRAQQGRFHPVIRRGWFTECTCWLLFFYLPAKLRRLMLKDLRGLARDAKQWSQMAIMFGLLVIYVLNLPRLPVDLGNPQIKGLIAFLNLTTVSLFLATFTSRFVYPLLSLESQQLWLLELLPVRRTTLLIVKFLFALTVTLFSAVAVMGLAVVVLELPPIWSGASLLVCAAICIGLSGLSIGLGARFPVLGHRNPARIASGFGGTFNLIASMLFVGVEMVGVAYIGAHSISESGAGFLNNSVVTPRVWQTIAFLVCFAVAVAAASITFGARHFERLET
jgi:ABC-2 type transport system permease protein